LDLDYRLYFDLVETELVVDLLVKFLELVLEAVAQVAYPLLLMKAKMAVEFLAIQVGTNSENLKQLVHVILEEAAVPYLQG